jgi:electron transfer flavoprotein alpha subunit
MAQIVILARKCTGCGACVESCSFAALRMEKGQPQIGEGCVACGACLRACAAQAIVRLETKGKNVDKSKWKNLLVYAEQSGGRLHPVSLELIGKALSLARGTDQTVKAVLLGEQVDVCARELCHYGVSEVYVYDSPELAFFRADAFAACVEDAIRQMRPGVVLVGATALGRSLAPRLATRFHTGLTADCTGLSLRENGDLVQTRPAFGGNIMAQIITPDTRPQFATVRYKVMDALVRSAESSGLITPRKLPRAATLSPVSHVSTMPLPKAANISDADILVVAGRGLQKESDLKMVQELASLLGGEWATSRPLVEKGWSTNLRQIGLSGRTVRPKLIITCGVSGAIQFAACMNQSDHIVAINKDPEAPIFKVAHVGIVGDLYTILPDLIARLKTRKEDAAV